MNIMMLLNGRKYKCYTIRIFDAPMNDDKGYANYEADENILVEQKADTITDLIILWKKLIKKYEGWTYCVLETKLTSNNQTEYHMLVGGALDPSDIDIIEEYKFVK